MAYTSSDLSALERAIKSGARRVKYENREVEYRSLDEMQRLRNQMRRELGLAKSYKAIQPKFDKGL